LTVRVTRDAEPEVLGEPEVTRVVSAALRFGGRADLAVEVVLVDDSTLAELHGRFLGDESPTDVLACDLGEDGNGPGAEIYASVERALEEANAAGAPPAHELAWYLVHGALHLCGYDDHDDQDRARMRSAESEVLRALGYAPVV